MKWPKVFCHLKRIYVLEFLISNLHFPPIYYSILIDLTNGVKGRYISELQEFIKYGKLFVQNVIELV